MAVLCDPACRGRIPAWLNEVRAAVAADIGWDLEAAGFDGIALIEWGVK